MGKNEKESNMTACPRGCGVMVGKDVAGNPHTIYKRINGELKGVICKAD